MGEIPFSEQLKRHQRRLKSLPWEGNPIAGGTFMPFRPTTPDSQKIHDSVARFAVGRDNLATYGATAFAFNAKRRQFVATAGHCMESDYYVYLQFANGFELRLNELQPILHPGQIKNLDLYVATSKKPLLVPGIDYLGKRETEEFVKWNDLVMVVGYPGKFIDTYPAWGKPLSSIGEIEPDETAKEAHAIVADIRVDGGNSGSPLMTLEGKALGVVARSWHEIEDGENEIKNPTRTWAARLSLLEEFGIF